MVFETVKDPTHAYYESVDDASDIADAFLAGQNVVLHFPATGDFFGGYARMIEYQPAATHGSTSYGAWFGFENEHLDMYDPEGGRTYSVMAHIASFQIAQNGKLQFNIQGK